MRRWEGEKVRRWEGGKVRRWEGEEVGRWEGEKVESWDERTFGPLGALRFRSVTLEERPIGLEARKHGGAKVRRRRKTNKRSAEVDWVY